MSARFWLKLTLVTALLLVLLASAALVVGASLPSLGQIAYISAQSGEYRLYLMDVERRLSRPLLNREVLNCCLSWSPDGQEISFMMRVGLSNQIFVLETHQHTLRQLTHQNGTHLSSLAWSPDGSSALMLTADNQPQAIYRVNPHTGHSTPLDTRAAYGYSPEWSPDGTRLAFVLGEKGKSDVLVSVARGENTDIYLSNPDGGEMHAITDGPLTEMWPVWSPDSRQIAYIGFQNHESQLYLMDADGTHVRQLTSSGTIKSWPLWSPDGDRIAFLSQQRGKANIAAVDPRTGEEIQLMDSDLLAWRMEWASDGRHLIFEASHGSSFEIYLLDGETKQPVQVTTSTSFNVWPVWRPR